MLITPTAPFLSRRLRTPKIMESVVPPQITAELTQILSNLVLGDNEIRAKYVPLSPFIAPCESQL